MTHPFIDMAASRRRVFHAAIGVPPPGGYRLLLLLDGNSTFAPAVEEAERRGAPLLVAGIGYPETDRDAIVARRFYDLTSLASPATIPRAAGTPAPRTGGRTAFAAELVGDILPALAAAHAIGPGRATLFGHSLGGAFCLHMLLTGTPAFDSFVAADPSIWWNGGELWQDSLAYAGPGPNRPLSLSVMTSGKRQQRPGQSAMDARRTAELRSGPGGREMAQRLAGLAGLSVDYRHFPDETHGSLMPVAVRQAIVSAIGVR